MKIQWRDIVGYEGNYQISNTGLVKSLPRKGRVEIKILSASPSTWGYEKVHLSKDKIMSHFSVHSLVAKHFIGECPPGKVINHKDGNKKNNQTMNLEYVDPVDNYKHGIKNNLFSRNGGQSLRFQKKAFLILKKSEMSFPDIAKALSVHYRTILRWDHRNNNY